MIKILFVCLGNICRSPMAEFVMKDLAEKAGLSAQLEIASAATSSEEEGNPVYPPARQELMKHGISCLGKTARPLRKADYAYYDLIIGMEDSNLRAMRRIFGGDPEKKLRLLLTYAGRGGGSPTPGIPGILRRPGAMCYPAARGCWKACKKLSRTGGDAKKRGNQADSGSCHAGGCRYPVPGRGPALLP